MSGILRWLDDWAEEFCVSVMLALLVLLLGMEVFSRFLLGRSRSRGWRSCAAICSCGHPISASPSP